MNERIVVSLWAMLLAMTTSFAAEPAPAAKSLMAQQAVYLTFEISQTGTKEFSGTPDALSDGAYRITRSVKYVLPFDSQLPDSCPSSVPMEEAMEQGRCMGWAWMMPDDPTLIERTASGKLEFSKNPMYAPAEFSIDMVQRTRLRHISEKTLVTETRTSKGSGIAYVNKGGMLLCDFKKLTCDLSGAVVGETIGLGADMVTVTSTSDIPGSETTTEKQDPKLLLPPVPKEITDKLMGFPITLPAPSTKTFAGPGVDGPDVILKMTLSGSPAIKPASK